ncbi:hypothetical protein TELCIR_02135 [Teladorsagia circumcincta]|uniref:Uncharacterized protein n=1 Tax=Teladorsagia circumcincta TaxID=45464 RepID=A0A2G9V244_TELCI|nr:hypothetical protein TELCIR_02135 [Teladorsagia circumcincta]
MPLIPLVINVFFLEIHAIPIGSDQLHSVDPSWPDEGENSDLGLTHKSSLRGPRHVLQGPRSRVKRFRSSEKLEWSSPETWRELAESLPIPTVSAREWRLDSRPRLRPPPGRVLSESLENDHSSALRWVSSELLSHRSLSSSSSWSSSEQIDDFGQELRFERLPRSARYRSATDVDSLKRVGNYSG